MGKRTVVQSLSAVSITPEVGPWTPTSGRPPGDVRRCGSRRSARTPSPSLRTSLMRTRLHGSSGHRSLQVSWVVDGVPRPRRAIVRHPGGRRKARSWDSLSRPRRHQRPGPAHRRDRTGVRIAGSCESSTIGTMSSTCRHCGALTDRPVEHSAWPSVTPASSARCPVHMSRQPPGVVCVVVAGELDPYGVDTLLAALESHHTVGTASARSSPVGEA